MPKLVGEVEMVSLRIRLPKSTLQELNDYAKDSGMYENHFYQAAIVAGARLLAQVFRNNLYLGPIEYNDADSVEAAAEEMSLRAKADRLRRAKLRGPRPKKRTRVDDWREGLLTGGVIPPSLDMGVLDSEYNGNDGEED